MVSRDVAAYPRKRVGSKMSLAGHELEGSLCEWRVDTVWSQKADRIVVDALAHELLGLFLVAVLARVDLAQAEQFVVLGKHFVPTREVDVGMIVAAAVALHVDTSADVPRQPHTAREREGVVLHELLLCCPGRKEGQHALVRVGKLLFELKPVAHLLHDNIWHLAPRGDLVGPIPREIHRSEEAGVGAGNVLRTLDVAQDVHVLRLGNDSLLVASVVPGEGYHAKLSARVTPHGTERDGWIACEFEQASVPLDGLDRSVRGDLHVCEHKREYKRVNEWIEESQGAGKGNVQSLPAGPKSVAPVSSPATATIALYMACSMKGRAMTICSGSQMPQATRLETTSKSPQRYLKRPPFPKYADRPAFSSAASLAFATPLAVLNASRNPGIAAARSNVLALTEESILACSLNDAPSPRGSMVPHPGLSLPALPSQPANGPHGTSYAESLAPPSLASAADSGNAAFRASKKVMCARRSVFSSKMRMSM